MKFYDSEMNMGGYEKKHLLSLKQEKKLSLFELHREFDEINGTSIMALEVFI